MNNAIEELAGSVPIPLETAAQLIPMPSVRALYAFLNRHKDIFPGVYRTSGGRGCVIGGFEQRFLTKDEILKIREMTFHPKSESRFVRAGRPSKRNGIIGSIIRRCEEARG